MISVVQRWLLLMLMGLSLMVLPSGVQGAPITGGIGDPVSLTEPNTLDVQILKQAGVTVLTTGDAPVIPSYTVATLPTGELSGATVEVIDGTTGQDCTVGGGGTSVQCRWDGTVWRPFGDGSTAGAGGAPDTAQYVLTATDPTLPNARLLGTSVLIKGTHMARPSAGTRGRIYIYSDAPFGFSYDTGTVWEDFQIAWAQITSRSVSTADLNFDVATQAELTAHAGEDTNVHGIADTSLLVTSTHPGLTDQRTPLDNSVTSSKIANSEIQEVDIHSSLLGPAAAAFGLRKLGTGGMEALPGNHASTTNARSPIGATSPCTEGNIPVTLAGVFACGAQTGGGGGVTSVEGLTGVLDLTTGTGGTAPAFSGSGGTITLDIPPASTTGTTAGLLSNMAYIRIPSSDEKAGLAAGSPSAANPVITQNHTSVTNARTPTAHASSHYPGGSDPIDSIYATKTYVDSVATGLQPKTPPAATMSTTNITLSGEQTISGVLTSASRVLVTGQTTASANGLYLSAAGAWARTADADLDTEIESMSIFISGGDHTGETWVLTTPGPIVLGTTNLVYGLFSTSSGSGETNTGENVGSAGVGVFKQKSGVALQFKQLNPASTRVSIVDDTANDEVDFDVVEANLSLANLGGMATKTQINDAGSWNVSEIPNLPATIITSGTLSPTVGGTGASNAATAGRYLKGNGSAFLTSDGAASGVGSCTNQVVTATNSDAAPTCGGVTSAMVTDGTLLAADLNANAELTKLQITDGGQWGEPEIPVLTIAKYADALLLDGSRIATKVVIDDTDVSPVADRQLQTKGGLLQVADTTGAEGRYLKNSSLEVLVTANYGDASITQTKLVHGTGAGDANTLTLHDLCTGTPDVGDACLWNGTDHIFSPACVSGGSTPLGGGNQLLGMTNAGDTHEFKTIVGTPGQVFVTHNPGSITLSLAQNYGQSDRPILGGLTLNQGTLTSDLRGLEINSTWNNAATAFKLLRMNADSTASAAAAELIRAELDGVVQFRVQKDGLTEVNGLGTGVVTVTSAMSPYTIPTNVKNVLCDSTAGAVMITAPSAGAIEGRELMIKKINTGTNNCTVNRAGADDFEEATSFVLNGKYQFRAMVSGAVGGTRWYFTGGL